MEFDVIVSGAGPAGSTAARECATRGLSVVLLDKAVFPRDKPCGGGVNVRAARLLPFQLGPVAERTITGMYISVRQRNGFYRFSAEPLSYLTQRRLLDTFLIEKARLAGVTFHEGASVRAVERNGASVVVRAGTSTYTGRCLLAADGANGPTARLAGIAVQRKLAIALEANFPVSAEAVSTWQNIFAVDVGATPGGYGWLFPKGDHVNIGVGGWSCIGPSLRERLDHMARFYGFDPKSLTGLRGHPLPVAQRGARFVDGNVAAIGDAAGLLDPLSGEGIYSAIWSGCAASRHAVSYLEGAVPSLDGYQAELERELLRELQVAGQLRDLFHLAPPVGAALVHRSPRVWRAVCRLLTGDQSYVSMKNRTRTISIAIDLAADVVRVISHCSHRIGAEDTPQPEHFLRRLAS